MLVLALSGSLRAKSYNTALLRAAGRLLPPAARLALLEDIAAIPPYVEDLDPAPPTPIAALRKRIAAAGALLIATPEYNGSLPGQFKNALDWASRPYPSNALRGKPAAVVGASTGPFGAVRAQAEARTVLRIAGANVLAADLAVGDAASAFRPDGRLRDSTHEERLAEIVGELVAAAAA